MLYATWLIVFAGGGADAVRLSVYVIRGVCTRCCLPAAVMAEFFFIGRTGRIRSTVADPEVAKGSVAVLSLTC